VTGAFDSLAPDKALNAVERAYGLALDGMLFSYPSYINRVYGLRAEGGGAAALGAAAARVDAAGAGEYVVKFYRPGRWSREAVLDEHRFLLDCAQAELPVIAPLAGLDGETLARLAVADEAGETEFLFALFPKRGGRNFDAESEEDWRRLGGIVARCHAAGRLRPAPHRIECRPDGLTRGYALELLESGVVHPDCREEFEALCAQALDLITPLFAGAAFQRVHGDCHRGNILDRPGEGLLLIDFDDMMNAPPVQDLWLLLPGHAADCRREIGLLLEAYEQFLGFDAATLSLIEPLRFMRMIYFLAWRSRQRHDYWFVRDFPEWGGKAFWMKELEDLREQLSIVRESLDGELFSK
jgi:Ser/Thr protein kinase RdoA (MazF antagonist)